VTVLGRGNPGSHKKQFWVYIGPSTLPYDMYDFTANCKRDAPLQCLVGYRGYLQADVFSGYDGIYTGSGGRMIEVTC
jgi:hypothetical protein